MNCEPILQEGAEGWHWLSGRGGRYLVDASAFVPCAACDKAAARCFEATEVNVGHLITGFPNVALRQHLHPGLGVRSDG